MFYPCSFVEHCPLPAVVVAEKRVDGTAAAFLCEPRADMTDTSNQISIIPQGNSSSTNGEPHSIRITNHGKIKSWVDFSLNSFKVNELFESLACALMIGRKANDDKPLVFHTLPAPQSSQKSRTDIHDGHREIPPFGKGKRKG